MTREEAIRTYVENLSNAERVKLIKHMSFYDDSFKDVLYYDMDEFDEILSNYSPMEIAQMICFGDGFDSNDDYFCFNNYGSLESADWYDVEKDVEDLIDDIIDHLVNDYKGDTPWTELDYLLDADDDAIFNDDLEEVETRG